ncbi:MAG TPA: MauE/DoxX family redox-associated membrane protein [Acidimicrobiales bacterium]|nr:MauE/DoxX family redox-associated membrane protein [Acidimicrobiales bacterium]
MDLLQVPFTSAALLLAIAGVQKLRDPQSLSRGLRLAGLPHGTNVVRGLAAIEIATAAAAVIVHHRIVPLVVAVLYLSFAAFVTWALSRGLPIESCGCFGRGDARPSAAHVALDTFAAAIAALVALDDVEPVRALIADEPATGVAVVTAAAVLASLTAAWLRGSRNRVAVR